MMLRERKTSATTHALHAKSRVLRAGSLPDTRRSTGLFVTHRADERAFWLNRMGARRLTLEPRSLIQAGVPRSIGSTRAELESQTDRSSSGRGRERGR